MSEMKAYDLVIQGSRVVHIESEAGKYVLHADVAALEQQLAEERSTYNLNLRTLQHNARVDAAEIEERWKTWGVVEIAVRNPNVASYAREWEERATKAEQHAKEADALLSAPVMQNESTVTIKPVLAEEPCVSCGKQTPYRCPWDRIYICGEIACREAHEAAGNCTRACTSAGLIQARAQVPKDA